MLLLFRSASNIGFDLFRRQPACDTQFCMFMRSAGGHPICMYIYTYIASIAAVSNEKATIYNPQAD